MSSSIFEIDRILHALFVTFMSYLFIFVSNLIRSLLILMTVKFSAKNKKQLSDPFPPVVLSSLRMSRKTNLLLIISVIVVQLHNTWVVGKIVLLVFRSTNIFVF